MNGTRPTAAIALIVVLLTAAVTIPVAPAAAQSDGDSLVDAIFQGEDTNETGTIAKATAYASAAYNYGQGAYQRLQAKYTINVFADTEPKTASEHAANVQTYLNEHNTSILEWVNARSTANSEWTVIAITFQGEDSRDTHYILTDVNTTTDNFTSGRMVESLPSHLSGSDVDKEYRLSPYATRSALGDLKEFHTTYVTDGETPPKSYLARMAGKYRGEITGDDLPGENK